jgi:AcrR family transcriptional regulator
MASPPGSNPQPLGGEAETSTESIRAQRTRLLEAMMRLSAQRGYEPTTVEDVVRAAGVPRESFDRLFDDKEACFLEAYDAVIDVLVAHVSSAYDGARGQPWPRRMVAGLRAFLELLAAESDIARMAMVDVTALGDEARVRYRAAMDRFLPFLEEGRSHCEGAARLPPETERLAIGGATSMVFDEIRAGRGPELPRILPDLVFAVLMPYVGPEAAEDEMNRVGRVPRAARA